MIALLLIGFLVILFGLLTAPLLALAQGKI